MAVLASVAMDLVNDKAANRAKMDSYVEKAAAQNADFVLFPELALGGVPKNPMFIFNPDDAKYQHDVAELVPEGDSTQHFIEMAKKLDIYIGWGMAEQSHERFDALYNTLVVVGPEGFVGKYRKVHQPLTERIMFYSGSGDYPRVRHPLRQDRPHDLLRQSVPRGVPHARAQGRADPPLPDSVALDRAV